MLQKIKSQKSKAKTIVCHSERLVRNLPPQSNNLTWKIATSLVLQLKNSLLAMTMLLLLYTLTFTLLASPVYAACDDPNVANRGPECPAGLDQIEGMIANIISVILGLGFIAMLVLLIWAGFKYLTSGGEPKAVAAAHDVTTWALLGILFMAVAWLVLQLVKSFTGIDVTVFNIKTLCDIGGKEFCKP